MGGQPGPRVERKRHFHAFEVYRDLGYARTYRAVARQIQASPHSVCRWAKWFKWDERIIQYSKAVVKKKEAGGFLVKADDPVTEKLGDALNRIEALIDGAFIKEADGNLIPQIKVKSVDELTKLISEYRRFLETYHSFVSAYRPPEKEKERKINVKEFNVHIESIPQEERIVMMKGLVDGNIPEGDTQPPGRIQDADFEQVPERRDEDGLGCDGVSGSPASSGSGNETPVRES